MTSEQSWLSPSRPPTLEIPPKFEGAGFFASDLLGSAAAAGSLSPDIRLNSPPLFGHPSPASPAASVLKIGNYLLTDRLADVSGGVAMHHAVHVETGKHYVCRAIPLDRCYFALTPYAVVGSHPNIDDVKEIVMGATCAYVMHETLLTYSEDLHAYVRRRRRLPEPEAARLFAQLLDVTAHCHHRGVVVRDIKLRRFVFVDDERTWLKLDGLYDAAIFDGADDQLTDKHGCLAYVSPEILDATFCGPSSALSASSSSSSSSSTAGPSGGGSYSGRAADMWSLGVMLYTMLVGRYPFADSDACALFSRIRRGRYPMPVDVPLSPAARCLIRSLLTVKPEDRLTAEEALRHPWFRSVESEEQTASAPSSSSSSSSSQATDDSVVPQCDMAITDDFAIE